MPDAVQALLAIANAPRDTLTRTAYNVTAFNPSADEIRQIVQRAFPRAVLSYELDPKRQGILDTWPEDVDDSAARHDWAFAPAFDLQRAFDEYLIPAIRERYQ